MLMQNSSHVTMTESIGDTRLHRGLLLWIFALGMMIVSLLSSQAQVSVGNTRAEINAEGALFRAQVNSILDLTSVEVTVGNVVIPLQAETAYDWKALVPTDLLPKSGLYTARFKATDALGNFAISDVPFRIDRLPTLQIVSPLPGTTLTTDPLQIEIRATDDIARNVPIRVYLSSLGVAWDVTRTNLFKETFGVNPDGEVLISIKVLDGQTPEVWRYLRLPPRPSSTMALQSSSTGMVRAVKGDRYLSTRTVHPEDWAGDPALFRVSTLEVGHLNSGLTRLYDYKAGHVKYVHGHENGFFVRGDFHTAYDYRSTYTIPLSVREGTEVVRGEWGAWKFSAGDRRTLVYSFSQGDFAYTDDVGTILDVSPSGDVLTGRDVGGGAGYQIFLNRAVDPARPLGERRSDPLPLQSPAAGYPARLDGQTVAYFSSTPSTTQPSLRLHTSTEDVQTSIRDLNFQIAGGWVGFTKSTGFGSPQIWTRSPEGVLKQRSIHNATHVLERVLANGWVIFRNTLSAEYYGAKPGRYVGIPGIAEPIWISTSKGWVDWDADLQRLQLMYFRHVYAYEFTHLFLNRDAASEVALELYAPVGQVWNIEASTDLRTWRPYVSITNSMGSSKIPVNGQGAGTFEFFRASRQ